MVIKGVREKFEQLSDLGFYPNNSSFILCDCNVNDDKYELKTIIPLENNMSNIVIDRKNLVLTDTRGNKIIKFNNNSFNRTAIEFVNGNDLILSSYELIAPKFVPKRIYENVRHYHYDNSLNLVNVLFDKSEGRLCNIKFLNDDSILIDKSKNLDKKVSLYSIKQKRFISPNFYDLKPVESTNDKVYKFTDRIRSSLEINGIGFISKIIGFITIDGKFYNGVYDELSNKEIECDLNPKPCLHDNFEEYNKLKEMIQGKLNEKVVKESNKQVTRDFIIKKLENKAKKII